jgi:hypothetical protein
MNIWCTCACMQCRETNLKSETVSDWEENWKLKLAWEIFFPRGRRWPIEINFLGALEAQPQGMADKNVYRQEVDGRNMRWIHNTYHEAFVSNDELFSLKLWAYLRWKGKDAWPEEGIKWAGEYHCCSKLAAAMEILRISCFPVWRHVVDCDLAAGDGWSLAGFVGDDWWSVALVLYVRPVQEQWGLVVVLSTPCDLAVRFTYLSGGLVVRVRGASYGTCPISNPMWQRVYIGCKWKMKTHLYTSVRTCTTNLAQKKEASWKRRRLDLHWSYQLACKARQTGVAARRVTSMGAIRPLPLAVTFGNLREWTVHACARFGEIRPLTLSSTRILHVKYIF